VTDLRSDGHAAIDWAADYLERVGELPVLAQVAPGDIRARLPAHPPADPEPFAAVLRDLDEIILPGVTHWQHPRYFAYFATASAPPAILAELLAATLNSVAILWRTAPASTELEAVVCDWVAQLLGLPAGWHGHIEDTASTSTLAAAIAARHATGRGEIVCSEMVVATVGTTASTAVDPVLEIARRAHGAGAWLHVDAAYAGSAMVCPELRWAFDGVAEADSLVVNPHKWMLVPTDCSILWSSRPDDLRAAFSLVPEYLRTPDAEDALSLSEYGPALGRRFRSLKLWAVLRCYGRSGLQAHIRSGIELAERFAALVEAAPGWEIAAPQRFSVVCFTGPVDGVALLDAVNASGEAFLSHAVLDGRHVLRLAVGGMLTTAADIDRTWEVLQREAAEL
jgi:aromatic-L-amino-acid decarboxylase